MSASYENEQKQLEARIEELKSQLAIEKDIALNTKHFFRPGKTIYRYTGTGCRDHQRICRKHYRIQGRTCGWSQSSKNHNYLKLYR